MTRVLPRTAGQPLLALAAVLIVWIGVRSVLWQSPFPAITDFVEDAPLWGGRAETKPSVQLPAIDAIGSSQESTVAVVSRTSLAPVTQPAFSPVFRSYTPGQVTDGTSASHQILWMTAMAHSGSGWEGSAANVLLAQSSSRDVATSPDLGMQASRWSFDSWLFLRQNAGVNPGVGPSPATYGGSQAGAVMRYRLSRSSGHRPAAYVRVTKALSGSSQGDISAGLLAHPVSELPVAAMVEGRLSRNGPTIEIRPAALVVSELPDIQLPLEFRGRAYAQAGYVGGDFATGFADGQIKLDRKLGGFDLGTLHAGAGAWGGIQKGAERVDVGPTASLTMKVGDAPVRIAMDYRHRIAGDAVPQSGIALTVSTGF